MLEGEARKDAEKRREMLNTCELAVLCLPRLDAALQPLPTPPRRRCAPAECRLMALTSDALNAEAGDAMERAILQSVDGGATMVQIRDKTEDFGPISGIP